MLDFRPTTIDQILHVGFDLSQPIESEQAHANEDDSEKGERETESPTDAIGCHLIVFGAGNA
jgi:hypothetical protein